MRNATKKFLGVLLYKWSEVSALSGGRKVSLEAATLSLSDSHFKSFRTWVQYFYQFK